MGNAARWLFAVVLANLSMSMADAKDLAEADVRRDVSYVTMMDGTRISYISYRPKSGRYPTIFVYSPYRGSAMPFEFAKEFLDAGYAFVGANFPATGCSEGAADFWHDEPSSKVGPYGAAVVEWIAKQPWSNGNVGMVGNSSEGTSQFWVAAERPPHLRALVASGLGDDYEFLGGLGGMLQMGVTGWAIRGENVSDRSGMEWRVSQGDRDCATILGSNRRVIRHSSFDLARQHQLKGEWWHAASLTRDDVAGKVNVPTMLIAAWQDEYGGAARGSIQLFNQLLPKVQHKKLVLMNGNHGIGGPGDHGYSLVDDERLKFLERWLKGVKNGLENESPVTVYWEVQERGEGDAQKSVAGWVTRHKAWPEPSVERRPFYLTGDAKLSPDRLDDESAGNTRAYLYPSGTELYGDNQQFALRPYSDGVLNYRTDPAPADMALLGNPEVTLYVSIDYGQDADFELTLKDIDPDGNVLFLQSGLLRASLRAVDVKRTTDDQVVHFFNKNEYLVPGKVYEIRTSLLAPVAHVVRQGHRLELTIGAPNPIPHRSISSIPAGGPSINRVYSSAAYRSKIVLPILPGAVARAAAPECGTLRGQPCRKEAEFFPGGL